MQHIKIWKLISYISTVMQTAIQLMPKTTLNGPTTVATTENHLTLVNLLLILDPKLNNQIESLPPNSRSKLFKIFLHRHLHPPATQKEEENIGQ